MLDWLLCALVKSVGWVLCRLPPAVCVAIGQGLGEVAFRLSGKRARIGERNLKAAFGERFTPAQRRRIIRTVFRNLGAGVLEMLRLPAIDRAYRERYIEMVPMRAYDEAMASGRPIIWLTGHFGNWELSSITAALLGTPIVAVARAQDDFPRLYRLLVSYRESKGCRIVHKGGAMRGLLRALQRGDAVGVVGDQATRQGIWVDFFGRPALFATGPFELARLTHALIVPAFISRVRGPHHQIMLDPPIDLSQLAGTEEEIVRAGIEGFAARLASHVDAAPEQWLWMHKRWKRTPQRRVVVLSDGKLGHVKQSQAVVQALRERHADVRERLIEVRYRHAAARALAVGWAWLAPKGWGALACLRLALTPVCFREAANAYADVVISCGAATAPVNVLMAADNAATSVVIMNPTPLPLSRFDLAFVPRHDEVRPRPNVIQTYGALSAVNGQEMRAAAERLRAHPSFRPSSSGKMVAVLLGGDTRDAHLTTGFVEALIGQVLLACEEAGASCLVTTSRRTPSEVERGVAQRLAAHPRCACLVLASRDPLEGTVDGMLGLSQAVVVTGESVSMVTEACASGRPVIIVDPPARRSADGRLTKPQRYVRLLVDEGYATRQVVPEVGWAVRRSLTQPLPVRRLNPSDVVREAVQRLA